MDALKIAQQQRDEIRAERDAALATVERLQTLLDGSHLSIEEINALPEAQGWWPIGMNDRVVRLVRAAHRAAIDKAMGRA